jgi:hypothetical protein
VVHRRGQGATARSCWDHRRSGQGVPSGLSRARTKTARNDKYVVAVGRGEHGTWRGRRCRKYSWSRRSAVAVYEIIADQKAMSAARSPCALSEGGDDAADTGGARCCPQQHDPQMPGFQQQKHEKKAARQY